MGKFEANVIMSKTYQDFEIKLGDRFRRVFKIMKNEIY